MYPYSKLSATTKDIRLLKLMPGSGNDPIEAFLSTESLQSKPIYEVGLVLPDLRTWLYKSAACIIEVLMICSQGSLLCLGIYRQQAQCHYRRSDIRHHPKPPCGPETAEVAEPE
jgi:hypothetical protein